MKKIFRSIFSTVAALLAAIVFSYGQSYSISPNDSIMLWGYFEDLQTLTINQVNNTQDTLYFHWKKVSESFPSQWEASVCDNRVCYTTLQDTGSMNPVGTSEYGFLLLHITPRINYGTAVIQYEVWENSTPLRHDTLTFILVSDGTATVDDINSETLFSAYPSVANSVVTFRAQTILPLQIFITDANGKIVAAEKANSGEQHIPVQTLPNGIYFLTAVSGKKHFTQKIIVQH